MALDEEVALITVKNVKNQNGFPEQQESKLTVDCREKSATRTEFYEALRSNITISLVLEVRIEDFELTGYATPNRKKAYATFKSTPSRRGRRKWRDQVGKMMGI